MRIAIIGSRGWSYAGVEDLVREFCPRLARDGHEVTVHGWATEEMARAQRYLDHRDGATYVYHKTTRGKFTGQMIVALKASIAAATSDCDVVIYFFIQNGVYSWIPRLFGKRVLSNVDGIMWKDPKWPWGFRHLFFPIGAYFTMLFSNRTITDSRNMQELYRKRFRVNLGWIGYGCDPKIPERQEIGLRKEYPDGYYLVMSRITPHNSSRELVEGFVKSGSRRALLLAGHTPDNQYVREIKELSRGRNVHFLGLVRDQSMLTQIIQNASAYLHGHSLGGINPALVRVVGLGIPALCVDTEFNREVVEAPNQKVQAVLFPRSTAGVAAGIGVFEEDEDEYQKRAFQLGITVRDTMSWESIYQEYLGELMAIDDGKWTLAKGQSG